MSQKTAPDLTGVDDAVPENSTMCAIAQSLIDGMPEPSDHAIEVHGREQAEQDAKTNVTDKAGTSFNSDVHAVDSDGNPKFTATGVFAKKRGRKSAADSVLGNSVKVDSSPQRVDDVIRANKQAAAGQMAANAVVMLGLVLGGEEWMPVKDRDLGLDEKANLEQCFTDYFTAMNMDDISPNMALGIGLLGYVLPRFTMPKTQARTKSVWGKAKQWWINRKLKKHGLEAVEIKAKQDTIKKES